MYIPNSTYRIQLQKKFNFKQLEEVLDYLHKLGISAIYASPVTSAVEESVHCYDGINPHEVNPEIGTIEQWVSIDRKLKEYNMGWVQDIVPNHMAYTTNNKWVFDMLERGRQSKYYYYFDLISQYHRPDAGEIKIMLPFLSSNLENAVRNKELYIKLDSDGILVRHNTEDYSVSAESFRMIAGLPTASQSLKEWCEKMQPENYLTLTTMEWASHKLSLFKELHDASKLRFELDEQISEMNNHPELILKLLQFQ